MKLATVASIDRLLLHSRLDMNMMHSVLMYFIVTFSGARAWFRYRRHVRPSHAGIALKLTNIG